MQKENAPEGALITAAAPEGAEAELREEADRLIAQLRDMVGYYDLLMAEARETGGPPNGKDAKGLLLDMGSMSRRVCAAIEGLDGGRRERAGIARGDYALDLAAARGAVLSRLESLARERRAKRVPR
ncbi:hypothetical protein BCF33_0991 [Hasllibacter halocynthiae]|uniref:Uncharacterized protein n=1 Tax=Hasllibacter halocynthiae TaxID=595589 RepID=A0A2T0X8W4_9RHOB|nr:hypothetical protein [Hasllibacter halocynthiae]PRY95373.1 hypothetical protein BCF33_0991 [Hasllibacter halocynthiae]